MDVGTALLAFDEYCRFDTSAFFSRIKRGSRPSRHLFCKPLLEVSGIIARRATVPPPFLQTTAEDALIAAAHSIYVVVTAPHRYFPLAPNFRHSDAMEHRKGSRHCSEVQQHSSCVSAECNLLVL
jgi:hypothetical protein